MTMLDETFTRTVAGPRPGGHLLTVSDAEREARVRADEQAMVAACLPPPMTVDQPPELPAYPAGLLNQAIVTGPSADPDIGKPIQYQPRATAGGVSFSRFDTSYMKAIGFDDWPNPAIPVFYPFEILTADVCSTFVPRDWVGRATALLDLVRSELIAAELWHGVVSAEDAASFGFHQKYLTNGDAIDVATLASVFGSGGKTGGVLGLAEAVGAFETVAGRVYGGRIMIHASPIVGEAFFGTPGVTRVGNRILTSAGGSIIVIDPGYDMTGDAGAARGGNTRAWIYATAPVHVDLSEVDTFGGDRGSARFAEMFQLQAQNIGVGMAEQSVRVSWDPAVHLKAAVDYSKTLAV